MIQSSLDLASLARMSSFGRTIVLLTNASRLAGGVWMHSSNLLSIINIRIHIVFITPSTCDLL